MAPPRSTPRKKSISRTFSTFAEGDYTIACRYLWITVGRTGIGSKKQRGSRLTVTLFKTRTVGTCLSAAVHHSSHKKATRTLADKQAKNKYSDEMIAALEQSLSGDRLNSYVLMANGNINDAIRLHEQNTERSEALYGVIQGLEISLRNAMHGALQAGVGFADWYEHVQLKEPESEALQFAKETVVRRRKPLSASRIVAQLNFGFWVRLTSGDYEKALWVPHLYKIFPTKTKRTKLCNRLNKIKDLRNKIAHHERIIDRDLGRDYEQILEAIAWVCPLTSAWVNGSNRFKKFTTASLQGSAGLDGEEHF